uniref:Uncharacterized protein n=1 Tax=Anopheles culicifacies TaxID=139723 RepID=A0A182MI33_9DIPT
MDPGDSLPTEWPSSSSSSSPLPPPLPSESSFRNLSDPGVPIPANVCCLPSIMKLRLTEWHAIASHIAKKKKRKNSNTTTTTREETREISNKLHWTVRCSVLCYAQSKSKKQVSI